MAFHVPEIYRIKNGEFSSSEQDGNNGAFMINGPLNKLLRIIASDGLGWEHVSVSLPNRVPTWEEMCFIKNIFWDEEDCVVEYHPPRSQYVNNCKFCLHLWKKQDYEFPLPDKSLVGLK